MLWLFLVVIDMLVIWFDLGCLELICGCVTLVICLGVIVWLLVGGCFASFWLLCVLLFVFWLFALIVMR